LRFCETMLLGVAVLGVCFFFNHYPIHFCWCLLMP
jgi:hypothetical protein